MKLMPRDGIFIIVIAVILAIIFMATMKAKPKLVPYNENHRRFYDIMQQGGERVEVEKGCVTCHGSTKQPLSKAHPPKEHCLLCHKLIKSK